MTSFSEAVNKALVIEQSLDHSGFKKPAGSNASRQKRARDDRSIGPVEKRQPLKTSSTVRGSSGASMIKKSGSCWSCGGDGHISRDCKSKSLKCIKCNEMGHMKKDFLKTASSIVMGP